MARAESSHAKDDARQDPHLPLSGSQTDYVSDVERTRKQPPRSWDYGRIRYFYECLLSGEKLDAIMVDNECDRGHIYPVPVLLDGHHRLAASHLARAPIIHVNYSGRLDLLRYLTGARRTYPPS